MEERECDEVEIIKGSIISNDNSNDNTALLQTNYDFQEQSQEEEQEEEEEEEEEWELEKNCIDGSVELTLQLIREQCKKHKGYVTPELNERLYLHYLGLTTITNAIDPYISCTVLYLNDNYGITNVQALSPLIHLKSLYLSHNSLTTLSSLPPLPELILLDVSHNMLHSFDGLHECNHKLETLLASHNQLTSIEGKIRDMTNLTTVDISFNRLRSLNDVLTELVHAQTTLRSVMLHGNELTRECQYYRKKCITALPELCYLDEQPVSHDERICAEAFVTNGSDGEAATRAFIAERTKHERDEKFRYYDLFRKAAHITTIANRQQKSEKVKYENDDAIKDDDGDGKRCVKFVEFMKEANGTIDVDSEDDNNVYIPVI